MTSHATQPSKVPSTNIVEGKVYIQALAEPQSCESSPETKDVRYQMHKGIFGVAHEAERFYEAP